MSIVIRVGRLIVRVAVPMLLLACLAAAHKSSFRTYSDSDGLTELNVNAILQARDGYLWVATTYGIFHFDGHRFRRYGVDQGLPSAVVQDVFERHDGTILSITQSGLGQLVGDRFVRVDMRRKYSTASGQVVAEDGAGRLYVGAREGLLWLSDRNNGIVPGTEGKQVWSVAAGSGENIWYALQNSVCSWNGSGSNCYSVSPDRWGALKLDPSGAVWVRSATRLLVLEPGKDTFVPRDAGLPYANLNGALSLNSRGAMMAPTIQGLAQWNGHRWSLLGLKDGLPMNSTMAALEDREGSLWIATHGAGLARRRGSGEWENWTTEEGLPSDEILALAKDRRNRLFIGSGSGLAALIDGRVSVLPIKTLGGEGPVRAVASAPDGTVWVGTLAHGAGRIEPNNTRIESAMQEGLTMTSILAIAVDPKGCVWVGGKGGIYCGTKQDNRWSWKKTPLERETEGILVFRIIVDRLGRSWAVSSEGLGLWNGSRWTNPDRMLHLPDRGSQCFAEGPDGSIWISYFDSNDLYRISGVGDALRVSKLVFSGNAEAMGQTVALGFDRAGSLWRGTGAGVYLLVNGHWTQYTREDGLSWNGTSRNAFVADSDGTVWLGTSRGLSHHLTAGERLGDIPVIAPPTASIADFHAAGQRISNDRTSRIDYRSAELQFDFGAPVFRRGKDVRFRYRLAGFDTLWTETADWEARYSRLPPGEYQMEVSAGTWDGRWSNTVTSLPVVITGPFWMAHWFPWFGAALLAAGALVFWRLRDLDHVRRERELRSAVQQRTEALESERAREKNRNHILEILLSNQPLRSVLDAIAGLIAEQVPNAACALILRNSDGISIGGSCNFSSQALDALLAPDAIPREVWQQSCMFEKVPSCLVWNKFISHLPGQLPLAIRSCPIGNPGGVTGAILLFYQDVPNTGLLAAGNDILAVAAPLAQLATEHKRLYEDLRFQAHHDSLTNLPNRILFQAQLRKAMRNAHALNRQLALIYIDVDHFKAINDRLGHGGGDAVLREIAARMKHALRSGDTLARIGGDEFNVLLEGIADPREAAVTAARLLDAIREPLMSQFERLELTASIGIAVFPADSTDIDELQRQADAAMYCAKHCGRNRVQEFSATSNDLDTERIDLALRRALQEDLFELHYQPKVARDGSFAGCEALLRLSHPKLRDIPPGIFIPVAEARGLIVPIGHWVLGEVCRQIAEWQREGLGWVSVAINVSPMQFESREFSNTVRGYLDRYGVPPECLEIELTENQLMSGSADARLQLEELRSAGIRLSIDDFGTGYSSLSSLYRLQLDTIKLDHSFVLSLATDQAAYRIVQAMLGVANALGLSMVAEGVETEAQRDALVSLGCPYMQGYLFGRPLSAAEFEPTLRSRLTEYGDRVFMKATAMYV